VTTTATASELRRRPAPPLGGFRLTVLGLEVRRLLRNRRTLIFTMITPSIFFLLFGLNAAYASLPAGPHAHGNVSADILISMALYGAVLATTSGGAMISIERAQGWSRQLLLTHKPSMPAYLWIVTGLCVWIGSLLFAAFGLFLGYLLPTENVMQFMGFIMMLLAFGGGLFIPLSQYPHVLQDLAQYTPLYGLSQLVRAPLLGGSVAWQWPVNVIVWLAIFVAGAVWRFRKDTARA
jgi:ABC-2 type transport system permease protein